MDENKETRIDEETPSIEPEGMQPEEVVEEPVVEEPVIEEPVFDEPVFEAPAEEAAPQEEAGEEAAAAANDLGIFMDEDNVESEITPTQVAPTPKKGSKGIVVGVAAVVVVVAIIALIAIFAMGAGSKNVGLSNMGNLGIGTAIDNKIYYASTMGNGLFVADLETLEPQELSTESILFLQNIDGELYYVDVVNSQLRKFVDGVNDEVICDELCYAPQFEGKYIYYLRPSDYFVYRIPTGGGEAERVLNVPCNAFYVDGKKLYFEDINSARFCMVDLNSAIEQALAELPEATEEDQLLGIIPGMTPEEIGAEVLFEGFPDTINVVNGAIYYSDSANGNAIYKYAGGQVTQLGSGILARYVNVYDGYIFYTNMNDYALYRMNLDGSDVRKLSGDGEMAINNCIVDDMVIYACMGVTGEMGINVVDTDGNLIAALPESVMDVPTDEGNSEEFDESIDLNAVPTEAPAEGEEADPAA